MNLLFLKKRKKIKKEYEPFVSSLHILFCTYSLKTCEDYYEKL